MSMNRPTMSKYFMDYMYDHIKILCHGKVMAVYLRQQLRWSVRLPTSLLGLHPWLLLPEKNNFRLLLNGKGVKVN